AKLRAQFAEPTRRLMQSLLGLKRISQSAPTRRARHELCDALRAFLAHRIRIEIALLPNQANEKINRHIMCDRSAHKRLAISIGSPRVWIDTVCDHRRDGGGRCVLGCV